MKSQPFFFDKIVLLLTDGAVGGMCGQSYETPKAPFVNARITTADLKDRHFAIVMKAYKALVEASHRQVLHSK